ncbi:sensor histidine kinase [Microbacterium sp. MAHUQ-60]|uniref:sensor histidine kinase n=1 Tax=unclassified Microbacterium TaxID=2609290 RepID=UPI003609031B
MLQRSRAASSPAVQYFGDRRSRSIWHWQFIIAFSVVAGGAGAALLTPARFTDARFSAGMLLVLVVTIVSLAVPWHLVGSGAILVLPVLDAVAVALIAAGGATSAAFLWVFPVAWAASYFSVAVLVGMLSLTLLLGLIGLFVVGVTAESTINMLMLMLTLVFVGVFMAVGSERNRSARRLLNAQSDRLAHALRRVNEQKARNLRVLNSLDIGVARVDSGGLVEVSNDTFRTLFALDTASRFHPTPVVEYRTRRGEAIPARDTSIARAARGELFTDRIVWLFGIDGRWRAVRTSTKPIGRGVVTGDGLLLIVEEITETADARAGEDATRRTISHELRNPLTAILGHVDVLLERDDLHDSAREHLEVVERAGSRMQVLIDRALGTSSARTDDADVEFDLADVARASLEAFAPAADSSGVTVEADLGEPLRMCGDEFRMRQLIDNVIGNAIKYSQRGGRVRVQIPRHGADEVALTIRDNGIGVSEEDLPHIFDRAFRTELARERGIPGTGLGLSISRDIVTAAGGRIDMRSALGRGSEVTVVLPAHHDPSGERNLP